VLCYEHPRINGLLLVLLPFYEQPDTHLTHQHSLQHGLNGYEMLHQVLLTL